MKEGQLEGLCMEKKQKQSQQETLRVESAVETISKLQDQRSVRELRSAEMQGTWTTAASWRAPEGRGVVHGALVFGGDSALKI